MIIDKLQNASKYYCLGENFEVALKFLEQTDLEKLECKKHVIDGEKVWANVQELHTKDEKTTPWEVHRRYTDIQYVISGCEKMGWANIDYFMPDKEFDFDNDIQFGKIKDNSASGFVIVPAGYFVIFTPNDIHKPALSIHKSTQVKKIVVKVEQ